MRIMNQHQGQQQQQPQPQAPPDSGDQRSGEGAQSALERLRTQERSKASLGINQGSERPR
jgi:hypothetical protein